MKKQNILGEIAEELKKKQQDVLKLWIGQVMDRAKAVVEALGEEWVKKFCRDTIIALIQAMPSGEDIELAPYGPVRENHAALSAELAARGIAPADTARLVFSLKDAILSTIQGSFQDKNLTEAITAVNRLVDSIGLFTFDTYVTAKELIIREQQQAILESSAPVVRVWDQILMVPLIGILDGERTQRVMEALLTAIEETQAKVAILDISGIPTFDSLVARHLVRTVSAARLMGTECLITGVSSRIAQTTVQLGIDLSNVITKTTMADGLKISLDLTGLKVVAK
jgi:rsbT co-antagonist protein RsbR